VLAGGRSSRMGSPKASLPWHGSTLLRRVTGIVSRCVDGPVVVVAAPGQRLPELAPGVEVAHDEQEYGGPLHGLAAGLAVVGDRAPLVYVSSTDLPLLHPAFVRRVLGAMEDRFDVALPEVGGYPQPLAAAYRTALLCPVRELIDGEERRLGSLLHRCRVRRMTEDELLRDAALACLDPALASVANLNTRSEYERALAIAAPAIEVERLGTRHGWTLGELAADADVELDGEMAAAVNGDRVGSADHQLPLVSGDVVSFSTGGLALHPRARIRSRIPSAER
jgi:molybdenum cofactor guanylyltransferase